MSKLIEDVLNFSKISMSAEQFIKTDLNKTLGAVLTDLELLITQKRAVIHSGDLPVVRALPSQMDQLFHNLLNNSLKFTKESEDPVINIDCHLIGAEVLKAYPQLDQSKKYFQITFKDNGIGFKPEFSEQIFNLFQRLDNSAKFSGPGIGLALCRKIANTNGGDIYAVGEDGSGAVFSVFLPEN
jgi:signal transduction histidine kinase